ncbi:capreomycidine synthase [Streptomyces sp. NPDC012461]|uniref:Capreomycidine synthase n=2 Tax=unclassified Streptomyces TaxID=2593676 RepID=A0A6G3R1V9_9ACTN|nr:MULTISPECIES: capreomycidine synthase [unclassified Streptomyces]NEA89427.1 capreomycidine synthase [Streptomyces sp. SID14436]NEC81649.1 capreomycidine synthase [Streptomyces sp. SID7958]
MRFAPARLEDWLRHSYFTARYDLGCSGVNSWTYHELDELLGLSPKFFDDLVFDDNPSFGAAPTRAAVARRWGDGDPDRVMVTHGSSEAIFLVTAGLLNAGDEVVVTDPAYHALDSVADAVGCKLVRWRLEPDEHFRPDLDTLRGLLSSTTRMVIVNFPHNPTGVTLSRAQQTELVELCAEHDAFLLWDGAFADLVYDPAGRLPDPAALYDKCVSFGTLSKAYGLPGLRFGWCQAAPTILESLLPMRDRMTLALSPMVERLATAVITDADRLLTERLTQARHNRATLADWIRTWDGQIDGLPAAGGVTTFPTLPVPDVTAFCQRLLDQEDVLLVPGECFGHPDHVRLGFGGPGDDFTEGLSRLDRALRTENP